MPETLPTDGLADAAPPRHWWAALAVDPATLVGLLMCATAIVGWCAAGSGRFGPAIVVVAVLLPLTIHSVGQRLLILARTGEHLHRSFPVVFLFGAIASAFLLTAVRLVSPFDIRTDAAVLCAVALLTRGRIQKPEKIAEGGRWFDALVVALALLAATLWARGLLPAAVDHGDSIVFQPWQDYFCHATLATQLGGTGSMLRYGNVQVSGIRPNVYHYASYVYPALLTATGQLTAYEAVTALWTPFGTFLSALAAYALVSSWWGREAGACALAGVNLLPDSAAYGAGSPWYSYHWLTQIGPAALYGIAASATALLLVVRGARHGERPTLALGLLVGLSVFAFKAQVFVALMPLLCAWPLVFQRGISPARRVCWATAVGVAGTLAILVANRFHIGPPIRFDGSGAIQYFKYSGGFLPESAFRSLHLRWTDGQPTGASLCYRSALEVLMILGALPVVGTALALYAVGARRLTCIDALPLIAIVVQLGLIVFMAPTASYELQHRPFVWAYFLTAVWFWGKAYSLLIEARPRLARLGPWLPAAVAVGLLAVPLRSGKNVQISPLPWAGAFTRVSVPRGLAACAAFLRTETHPLAVIQDSASDEDVILAGLAERRSYLCRPNLISGYPQYPNRETILRRRPVLDRLMAASDAQSVARLAAETGIRWFLLRPGDRVAWPETIVKHPAFASRGYAVYRLPADPAAEREAARSVAVQWGVSERR